MLDIAVPGGAGLKLRTLHQHKTYGDLRKVYVYIVMKVIQCLIVFTNSTIVREILESQYSGYTQI